MYQLFIPFALYWHFILDVILTHVFAIVFFNKGLPVIASVTMSVDAILKMTMSVLIAHLIIKISPLRRGKVVAVIRVSLILIWAIAIFLIMAKNNSLMIMIPFVVFKLLLLIDSSLSTEFIFSLRDYFKIDLSQSFAAQNILIRASTTFAPAIALGILSSYFTTFALFLFAILANILSTFFLRKLFFKPRHSSLAHSSKETLSLKALFANSLMRWGFLYQIISNLSLGGVALLFLSELNTHGNIFLNEITVLYFAFLITQIATLIFGDRIIPANTVFHIELILALCGLFILGAGICHSGTVRLGICSLIGFFYSLSLSALQKIVTAQLQGTQFVGYISWAQTAGRLCSLASISLLSIFMSMGILATTLLVVCGVLGMSGAWLLMLVKVTPTEDLECKTLYNT